jgi:hypothetical protein
LLSIVVLECSVVILECSVVILECSVVILGCSVVILGLDPRISIRVHPAELQKIVGATDARVESEHDDERAIPTSCEGLS